MDEASRDAAKRRAGQSAIEAVQDGAIVGLGSGSTAKHAILALGEQVEDGLDIVGIPTSFQARELAVDAGIELTTLQKTGGHIDVVIDGADQFASADLIKGGGGAHAKEKIVASAGDRFLAVVDETKQSDQLDAPVPVEILPDARHTAAAQIRSLGGEPTLREATSKAGPTVTDNGNLVLDCEFGVITDVAGIASEFSSIPGVVEHGLFPAVADEVHMGTATDVTVFSP
jgi:ribose 5-phosphate isomerase A